MEIVHMEGAPVDKFTKSPTVTPPVFQTKDWNIAALLLQQRLPLSTVRQDHGTTWFVFLKPTEAGVIIKKYIEGTLKVNARDFIDSQRRVKDLMFRRAEIVPQ